MGFIAGRFLGLTREAIAPVLIYLLAPITIFKGVLEAKLDPSLLSLPVIYIFMCSAICGIAWMLGKYFFRSPARNILAYSAGNSNSGYFGFPVAMAVLGPESFPRAVMISFGFVLYEATLGFYVTARGHHTASESFRKLLKIPSLYVFLLGLSLNSSGLRLPEASLEFFSWVKGSFSVLGMMLIGVALAQVKNFRMDWAFTSFAFFMKFLMWPLITGLIFWVDTISGLHFFSTEIRQSMWLVSVLPMAANIVAFASLLKAEPEKCALTVLLSTLLGILILPLFIQWLL
jgi:predicted permease